MRVILDSTNTLKYKNYSVYATSAQLRGDLDKVDSIVIHAFNEAEYKIGLLLSTAHRLGIEKFVYINSKPSELISGCIKSLHGVVQADDSFLEEDMLDMVFESFDDFVNYEEGSMDSLGVLDKFLSDFMNGSQNLSNQVYLERVNTALTEVKVNTEHSLVAINEICDAAIEVFNDLGSTLEQQRELRSSLEEKISKLEQDIKSKSLAMPSTSTGSLGYYPTYKYSGVKPVLYIKEKQNCWYLLSFLLAYQSYLLDVKNIKAKVIVAYQKLKDNTLRYGNFTTITQETYKNTQLLSSPTIGTFQPSKIVMDSLMYRDTDDIVIVLDRMYGDELVKGGNVKTLYATSSVRAMNVAHLPPNKTILPAVENNNVFMSIPPIEPYSDDTMLRVQGYFKICEGYYKKLNRLLDIED